MIEHKTDSQDPAQIVLTRDVYNKVQSYYFTNVGKLIVPQDKVASVP